MAITAESSPYSRSYNSFSGVDIKAVFANKVLGELQAISYSITREKAPIYTMGSADPRSFSRGKRGIAGTLVFVVFDRHVILSNLGGYASDQGLKFQSDVDDIRPEFRDKTDDGKVIGSAGGLASVLRSTSGTSAADTVDAQESPLTSVGSDQELASAWYADQIPPFDITLAAANEYGALAVMRIFGVELLNEGYGVSIDDIVSEQQHTYVARTIIGWTPVPSARAVQIASQGGTNSSS
jgi:hypothetical protein